MAGVRSANFTHHGGRHRAGRPPRQPYKWLGAGAITLGIGAAMAGGIGVAQADDGPDKSNQQVRHNDSNHQAAHADPKRHDEPNVRPSTGAKADKSAGGSDDPASIRGARTTISPATPTKTPSPATAVSPSSAAVTVQAPTGSSPRARFLGVRPSSSSSGAVAVSKTATTDVAVAASADLKTGAAADVIAAVVMTGATPTAGSLSAPTAAVKAQPNVAAASSPPTHTTATTPATAKPNLSVVTSVSIPNIAVNTSPVVSSDGKYVYVRTDTTHDGVVTEGVAVVSTSTNKIVKTINLGSLPTPGEGVNPFAGAVRDAAAGAHGYVYFSTLTLDDGGASTNIYAVQGTNLASTTTLHGIALYAIAASTDGKRLYGQDTSANAILYSTLSGSRVGTFSTLRTLPQGDHLRDISLSPSGSTLYVLSTSATYTTNSVYGINTATGSDVGPSMNGSFLNITAVNDMSVLANVINQIGPSGFFTTYAQSVHLIDITNGIDTAVTPSKASALVGSTYGMALSRDGSVLYVGSSDLHGQSLDAYVLTPDSASMPFMPSSSVNGLGTSVMGLVASPRDDRLYYLDRLSSHLVVVNTDLPATTSTDSSNGNVVVATIEATIRQIATMVTNSVGALTNVIFQLSANLQTAIENFTSEVQWNAKTSTPMNVGDLYLRLHDETATAPDGIYIEKIQTKRVGGEVRYIVYIGGTTSDLVGDNQSAITNLPAYSGIVKQHQLDAIQQALGGATDAKIMLVGYSQGGLDAQNIASTGRFNVTTVVTYGSPIITSPPEGYRIIHLEAYSDPIPGIAPDELHKLLITQNNNAGNIYNVRPSNLNYWYSLMDPTGIKLHGDRATYKSVGDKFDTNPGYQDVKFNISQFRGKVLRKWWS